MTDNNAHIMEGDSFLESGDILKAIASYRKAHQVYPDDYDINVKLGKAFLSLNNRRFGELALGFFEKALEQRPNDVRLLLRTGKILHTLGKHRESLELFQRTVHLEPLNIAARTAAMIHQFPVLYSDEEHLNVCRGNYDTHLRDLEPLIHSLGREQLAEASDSLVSALPFYLPYQGLNDRDLQVRYGALVSAAMSARFPEYAKPRHLPPLANDSRIRVGIVSAYFRNHSNWKVPIKGWIENLDRSAFELFGYHVGKEKDSATNAARECMDAFVEDCFEIDDLCRRIANDKLHVIIYPGIGMDRLTFQLAALRLAPVQCASWGHPVTTGLPTIDYFLSSDFMEPPHGDDHYSERLVRLPNLSIHYTPPEFQDTGLTRADFGLKTDSVVYVCAQSLFKLLPQYDYVFAAIAGQVRNSQFIFIDFYSYHLSRSFEKRLAQAFDRSGLCYRDHVVMLNQMKTDQFGAMLRQSDVYLDSIGWSGCNTTLEALQFDLPIVTMPGASMRSRHSAAILQMMDMRKMIAPDENRYIENAVRLGSDPEWRQFVREKIKANKDKVIHDKTATEGLEQFLLSTLRAHTYA